MIRGTLQTTYMGYEAISQRKKVFSFNNQEEYLSHLRNNSHSMTINGMELENAEDISRPLVQNLEIELRVFDGEEVQNFLFNPFLSRKWTSNPFKSNHRLYPVDFIRPTEYTTLLTLEYPAEFELAGLPDASRLALPASGGRYVFEVDNSGSKISFRNSLVISKTVFSSVEYHYLREMFSRMIQVQNGDLVFRKKI